MLIGRTARPAASSPAVQEETSMTRPRACLAIAASLLVAALGYPADPASARSPEIYTGILTATAVGGYDPVAYFSEGKPVEGRRDITWSWKGVTWRFASEKNRELFKAKPEAYAPQYGGHCAWAVSSGYTAKGDPKHWKIVNNKLYLNYNAQVQRDWERDVPGHIGKGDRNWPAVLGK
jgi:YHS domain-containing protein